MTTCFYYNINIKESNYKTIKGRANMMQTEPSNTRAKEFSNKRAQESNEPNAERKRLSILDFRNDEIQH